MKTAGMLLISAGGLIIISYLSYDQNFPYYFGLIRIDVKTFLRLTKTSLNEDVKEIPNQQLFPRDCKCQSLFMINACNESKPILNISDYEWQNIIHNVQKFRSGKPVLFWDIMANFIRYLPHIYRVKVKGILDISITNKEISQINNYSYPESLQVTPHKVPTVKGIASCGVHIFESKEVKKCTDLIKSRSGKPLRIAFVGDSMMRSVMQEMVKFTYKELNLELLLNNFTKLNIEKDFLEGKPKSNTLIGGKALELRFYWAPYLDQPRNISNPNDQGVIDLLEKWVVNSSEVDPIPDILYIGGGVWDGITESNEMAVDEIFVRMESIKSPLLKLSKKIRILWHMHPPYKDWIARSVSPNGALEMMNQLYWTQLNEPNIWIWETMAVLTMKEAKECKFYYKAKILKHLPKIWRCFEPPHPGEMARKSGMNMLFNLSCNRILGLDNKMCCS